MTGTLSKPMRRTGGEQLEAFMTHLERRGRSPHTQRAYRQTLTAFFRFMDGEEPSCTEAQRFLDSLQDTGVSPATLQRHQAAIKAYLKWEGMDCQLYIPRAEWIPKRGPTREEVDAIITSCRTPLERCLVVVLFDTGMRIAELLALQMDDVNWDEGMAAITRKGGRERTIPVGEKALEALKDYISWRRPGGELFPYGYRDIYSIFKRLQRRSGIEVTPHLLRHSCATELLRGGARLEDVKEFLGHSKYETTLRYTYIAPYDLKERLPARL